MPLYAHPRQQSSGGTGEKNDDFDELGDALSTGQHFKQDIPLFDNAERLSTDAKLSTMQDPFRFTLDSRVQ